jgi:hypothetical protein
MVELAEDAQGIPRWLIYVWGLLNGIAITLAALAIFH